MTTRRQLTVWIGRHEAHIFDADSGDTTVLAAPAVEGKHGFFRSVARALEGAERVLVVGPGLAKLEFVRSYANDRALEPHIIGIETVAHPRHDHIAFVAKRYFASK